MPKNETPGEAGLRKRNVELLSNAMEEFYRSGKLIDLLFLAEVMFLHVSPGDDELLSDRILRHLGFEQEGGKSIPPQSEPAEAPDDAYHQLGSRDERLRDIELGLDDFAENLETAQILWRRYPDLVEAEEFPEPFFSAMRRNRRTPPHHVDIDDSKLVEGGILPKPRSMRFNGTVLQRLIKEELISGFDDIAGRWAEDASAADLAVMHALMNTSRKPLDVLQDLLICDPGREDREPAKLAEQTGSRSSEASSAAGA
jgi:hypothetical protein